MSPLVRWRVLDLFSGAGGMSYGFHGDGRFKIVGAVDCQVAKPGRGRSPGTSTFCNRTYKSNIGIAPRDADLSLLSPQELRKKLGMRPRDLDVMISCAPCTGFSQKNAANHIRDDSRNRLVERTSAFVAEFLPAVLVMENVKELLLGNQAHHYKALAERLRCLDYSVSADVHDLVDLWTPSAPAAGVGRGLPRWQGAPV